MSLSTTKRQLGDTLHDLVDAAYFKRTILVASAHNMPVESFPWRFSSVISVGSHEEDDPLLFYANPNPPVEFFARGVDVDVAWLGGGTLRATGNSFATPSISGNRRAHPEQAPRADTVPAEERHVSDRSECGRRKDMTDRNDRLAAAVSARRPPVRGAIRAPTALDRRGRARDLRSEGLLDLPVRRGDGRARVCRGRRRGRAGARRPANSVVDRHRGLGALVTDTARHRGCTERSALRSRCGVEDGLCAEGIDGGTAAGRGTCARRSPGSSTGPSASGSR